MYGSAKIGGKFVTWEFGPGTNNQAEYLALIRALKIAKGQGANEIVIRMDSELVRNQVMGNWKVKDPALRVLCFEVKTLLGERLLSWQFKHMTGEEMKRILGH